MPVQRSSRTHSSRCLAPVYGLAILLSACATITGNDNQTVAVQTNLRSGKEVAGVGCELVNDKGSWFMVTPGAVAVRGSSQDMQVFCNKPGYETGRAAVVPDARNILGRVIIGPGDIYPGLLKIVMGESITISTPVPVVDDPPVEKAPKAAPAPQSAVAGNTVDEKLRELNRLYNAGLITREVYVEKQKWVLEGR